MQYITFLGVGPKDGYREVIYRFRDNDNFDIISNFVQEAIIRRYKNQFDDIKVIATKKAILKYKEEFLQMVDNIGEIPAEFIEIKENGSFEYFLDILNRIVREDFIVDVTHSFRDIPMTVMFSMNYIETSHKCQLLHLYYGKQTADEEYYEIVDFVEDYRDSMLGTRLALFNSSLKIDIKDVLNKYSGDEIIKSFLMSLERFNRMLEYCEFDKSIKAIRNITEIASSIINKGRYVLLIPFVNEIKRKFEGIMKQSNDFDMKRELIQLLLDHNLMQIAITFTDQFIREEIIHLTVSPNNTNYKVEVLKQNDSISYKLKNDPGLIYKCSQYLTYDAYGLLNGPIPKYDFSRFKEAYKTNIDKNKISFSEINKLYVKDFYRNIRNNINHGNVISMKNEEISNVIIGVLDNMSEVRKRWKNEIHIS